MDGRQAADSAFAAEASSVPFTAGSFLRVLPNAARLRRTISVGQFGKFTCIPARYTHAGGLEGWFAGDQAWMLDVMRAGFGGFGNLAIHLLDRLRWIRGDIVVLISRRLELGRPGALDVISMARPKSSGYRSLYARWGEAYPSAAEARSPTHRQPPRAAEAAAPTRLSRRVI